MEEEVAETADNARISLEEGEIEKFSKDFEEVLDIFGRLEKIDTEGVEPSFHPVDLEQKARPDTEEESDVKPFKNTGNTVQRYFKGPST